jgi:hypothetical protein
MPRSVASIDMQPARVTEGQYPVEVAVTVNQAFIPLHASDLSSSFRDSMNGLAMHAGVLQIRGTGTCLAVDWAT